MSGQVIDLHYDLLRKWWLVPTTTGVVLGIYYALGSVFRPEAINVAGLSMGDVLRIAILDQFLLECLTVFILFRLLLLWARLMDLNRVELTPGSIARYLLAFLPVVLLAFFVFNPITQTLRFLVRGENEWSVYLATYFYSLPLFLQYVSLTLPTGYFILVLNLVIEVSRATGPAPAARPLRLIARLNGMEHSLLVQEVLWFTVEERQYFAITESGRFQVNHTIQELESMLDPERFVRLNRQVLAQVGAVESFSPWFDGKYVVRMRGPTRTEFILSRNRAAEFRKRMGGADSNPNR